MTKFPSNYQYLADIHIILSRKIALYKSYDYFPKKKCIHKLFDNSVRNGYTVILQQPTMKQLLFYQWSILLYALFFVFGCFLDAFVGWHQGRPD